MRKKKEYLPLYYKWVKQGCLDGNSGLCFAFDLNGLSYHELDRFLTEIEMCEYFGRYFEPDSVGLFTPLRQNIVLLMAALNDEL